MAEEQGKTLTQLANELGVSRDKVIYRYKKLPQDYYYKENNTIYIKEVGVQQIIEELGDDIGEETSQEELSTQTIPSINEYLMEQLAKKDEQIEQLQKLIDQQQQLNAEDKKLIKELHQYFALEAPKEMTETPEPEETLTTDEEAEKKAAEAAEQLAKLEEQLKKAEELNKEKERLESELAALKQKKWYQFWK
ncbi:DUF536 domain-containing protein [Enterococcus saccharolyticus]|uniref:DUF536 domain-containing protein n=1 Tax=Enterococcus TaxID=1350 RepID=UPI001E49B3CC|nr:DUF536 domain-containing protein [Enterococcus saccharolyticus]MCD5001321.1 DUF536 domain-containing protein [Enterococcus saccharolyticus]